MKRRDLLQTSIFAGTWSLLSPLARAAGANSEIRVAVIGFNSRGMNHIDEILKSKGCRLVALCDVDEKVLAKGKEMLAKKNIAVTTFTDYRKLCESKEIDAVTIATPNHTHTLIALTAAANGKHVYVEKPVSHNVWEGRQLAIGAEKHKVIIQHGFQRRSETAWEEAFAYVKEGHVGKLVVARGLCYKPRPSIGKVDSPQKAPDGVDYDLWSGPREVLPIHRQKFHYDWHWQSPYGNDDLGNQGPHQLDVCRWALGDPALPKSILAIGGRLGYQDDGDTANTQILLLDHENCPPILFEVRGLPKEKMDYKGGMDKFKGESLGNVIEYENGILVGGHGPSCNIVDKAGKVVKSFKGGKSHMQNFIDSIVANKIVPMRAAESGHYSAALAHLGNISLKLGKTTAPEKMESNPLLSDAIQRMQKHLDANQVDLGVTPMQFGAQLSFDSKSEQFTGALADQANPLLKENYRKGFELPA